MDVYIIVETLREKKITGHVKENQNVFERPDASHPRWLLFPDGGATEDILRDVKIPFDSEFLVARPAAHGVELTEVYRVSPTRPLQIHIWGSWSPDKGLQGPRDGIYSRRHDLQGITLRSTAVKSLPFSFVMKDKEMGYAHLVYEILQETLNFSLGVTETYEIYGDSDENGTWNGVLGCLQRGEADVCLSTLGLDTSRLDVAAFSQPVLTSRNSAYIRQPEDNDYSWNKYLTPFSRKLWIAVVLSVLVLAGAANTVRLARRHFANLHDNQSFMNSFFDILHYVSGIFCSQAHWRTPEATSHRVIYWLSYAVAVIMWAAYSAQLVAHLTVKPMPDLPFTTFQGLLDTGTHRFTVMGKSFYTDYLQITDDAVLQKLYEIHIKPKINNLPTSYLAGFQEACKDKVVLVSAEKIFNSVKHKLDCKLVALPDVQYYSANIGLALRKGSPYNKIILQSMGALRVSGVLERIGGMVWTRRDAAEDPPVIPIVFGHIVTLILLMGVMTILAVLILALRLIHRKIATETYVSFYWID